MDLGRTDLDDAAKFKEIAAREQVIDRLLGRQLLPSLPIIIIGILQTLEAARTLNTASGSYGELYEAFITDRLATVSKKASDLGTSYTLLGCVAYWMYSKDADSFTRDDMRAIYSDYFNEYQIHLAPDKFLDDLVVAQIFRETDGNIYFKYRYYYHFFVARFFRDNIRDQKMGSSLHDQLRYMADRVYYEDYVNILVFYLYLTKDVGIIEQVLENASNIYRGRMPSDLESDVVLLNRLYVSTPKPIELPSADVLENRDRERRRLDEEDLVRARESGQKVCYSDDLDDFIKMNIAFRTLHILGQVLRNFPGSLKRDIKFRIAEQCYLLGLRVCTVVVSSISEHTDIFREYFARLMKQNRPAATTNEIAQSAEEAIIAIAEFWAFGLVKTISQAVGMEDLTETYREVLKVHGKLLSVQLVDLSIRLDHYGAFPENQVDMLDKRVKGNIFGYCVLRHLVAQYFYLFRCDADIRQRYVDRFEIQTRSPLVLGSGLRKDVDSVS